MVDTCPHSHYPCADGKRVAIVCTNDPIFAFARLVKVMGEPDLADPSRFGLKESRLANRDEVDASSTSMDREPR
ncbi:CoA transferase [Thioalkalivibrio sp. HK1]|uniref:CoA transferase n=1 Tax=Thioalkalivibrio sp. HK1 TaxID=1469245 RepID=UPI00047127E7|nr:CoA transferase [Thioalkalivibrio sp. HK1]